MKRQWKLDPHHLLAKVGEVRRWKGNVERLPAPWVHYCSKLEEYGFGWPYCDVEKNTHVIKKLDNLDYIQYLQERIKV
jgi:hypothetical protein